MKVKVKYLKVLIDMGPMTKVMKEVPEYELPVLIEKFGELEPSAKFLHETDSFNSAEAEMQRLIGLGVEEGTKQPFFNISYGPGRAGFKEFEKAYKAAVKPVKAKPAKKAKAPKVEKTNEAEEVSEKDPLE